MKWKMAKKITCKFHVQLHFWPFNLLFCKFNIFPRIFHTCFYLACEQTQIVRLFLILIRGIQCRSVLEKETWERTNEGTDNWIKHTIFTTVLFIAKIERLQQKYINCLSDIITYDLVHIEKLFILTWKWIRTENQKLKIS